jgi:RimJ/RimL family protein N-acetyltransferase
MITTARLTLRPFEPADADALFAINGDDETMRFFASTMTREESDDHLARMMAHWQEHGFGMFATVANGQVIGIVGLQHVPPHRTPEPDLIEIGWRINRGHWRQGYALEAAAASIAYARDTLHLPSIVALTARINTPSRAVMEKLGMTYDPAADFKHPRVPEGHALHHHVVYRLPLAR